ncbi:MAG TPA: 16S rRNA (cytosine(1402)-N(4))-methyltransferase RsmH [Candidatus Saccharimonadales bacterium]
MALTKQKEHHHNNHQPVLLSDTIRLLAPKSDDSYLDLTAGYGGHAAAVLAKTKRPDRMVLVDRDDAAIKALDRFKEQGSVVIHQDFLAATSQLSGQKFDMILADLGVSSQHFDRADRGFSFTLNGPLDMRMDRSGALTASQIVNDWPVERIADVIRRYGEEPRALVIAQRIVANRPINSTAVLAETIRPAASQSGRRKHPATRVFQAIRIAVNDELTQLDDTLPLLPDLMAPGGRLCIISFHSLEDRLVKQFFKELCGGGYEAEHELLTKRPIKGELNDVHNPRARSARLRAVVKIKNQKRREQ